MTEAEWLACEDPAPMLNFLGGDTSHRKLRLFMAACCRRVWNGLDYDEQRTAIGVAERYADGLADAKELLEAFYELTDCEPARIWDDCVNAAVADFAEFDVLSCAFSTIEEAVLVAIGEDYDNDEIKRAEGKAQAALLRCVCRPSTFRPVIGNRAWLEWHDGIVPQLAQVAYKTRKRPSGNLHSTRLAVLADALEEAGCTDTVILDHLRGPGPHVRGCWALDLIAGRS
jgi:hypothetical protein